MVRFGQHDHGERTVAHVEDRWFRTVKGADGKPVKERTARHGKGLRWRARYLDPDGRERNRSFATKVTAEKFLTEVEHSKLAGSYRDPDAGRVSLRKYAAGGCRATRRNPAGASRSAATSTPHPARPRLRAAGPARPAAEHGAAVPQRAATGRRRGEPGGDHAVGDLECCRGGRTDPPQPVQGPIGADAPPAEAEDRPVDFRADRGAARPGCPRMAGHS